MAARLKRTSLAMVSALPVDIQESLKSRGITTVELLAGSSLEEITSRTGMTRERSLELIKNARRTIGISGFKTARELGERSLLFLRTGIDCVDRALGERGFRSGSIVELQGLQWSGKTLMCSHLAVMAQLMETDDNSIPKVIWYDGEQTFRKNRIKEIAFRLRMDPEEVLRNIILVDVIKNGAMDGTFETMRKALAYNHVALVIIDSLSDVLRYLTTPVTLTDYIGTMSRLAQATGIIFIFTSRTQIGFSRSVVQEYQRRGSQSMIIDYGFYFHLAGERMRNVKLVESHGIVDTNCRLYIDHGGFFDDCASRNLEVRRVQRYLKRI